MCMLYQKQVYEKMFIEKYGTVLWFDRVRSMLQEDNDLKHRDKV